MKRWGGPRQPELCMVGDITPAAWGVPNASEWGKASYVAQKWATWLHNPYRQRFRVEGQNQKWTTSEPGGYITPPSRGSPMLQSRGTQTEVAHKWAGWLHDPCSLGVVPNASKPGTQSQVVHKWARWLHNPCHLRGSPTLQSGHNRKWPTTGQGGYITPAALGSPQRFKGGKRFRRGPHITRAASRGAQRIRAGDRLSSGPQWSRVAT